MIECKELVIFDKGKQKEFLLDVKRELKCTWREMIEHSKISRAMFYNYLKERHYVNKDVFDLLLKKSGLPRSKYYFRISTIDTNRADIPDMYLEEFAEFIGVLIGDGHLGKYQFQIVITLNSELETEYLKYLILLLKNLFKIEPKLRYLKNKRAVQIGFNSKIVSGFLCQEIGLPIGKRIHQPNNKIPDYILCNKQLLCACLRGLFDTEGSLSIRHHRAIRLSIYNNSEYLLESMHSGLQKLGFNSIKKTRSVRLNRTSEIIRFFNEIGSRNPYKVHRYQNWLKTGKLENVHAVVL